MTTTLITGANKGLGYETARQLVAAGHTVYTGARNPERGRQGVAYPASKAAVDMVTVQYAKAFPGIKINAVDPGYTATDLNAGTGTQTAEAGAEVIVRIVQIGPDGPTGRSFAASGPVAW